MARSSTSRRASLQWTWTTRPMCLASSAAGIAAGKQAVPGVVQQPDRIAAVPAHQPSISCRSARWCPCGGGTPCRRRTPPCARPARSACGHTPRQSLVTEPRALRGRLENPVMPAARRVGIHHHLGTKVPQQHKVRQDRVEFLLDAAIERAAIVPARHQPQPVLCQDRPKFGGYARKLAAELGPGVAGQARFRSGRFPAGCRRRAPAGRRCSR